MLYTRARVSTVSRTQVDEKTPHLHCVFVPITQEGSLPAAHFVGIEASLGLIRIDVHRP